MGILFVLHPVCCAHGPNPAGLCRIKFPHYQSSIENACLIGAKSHPVIYSFFFWCFVVLLIFFSHYNILEMIIMIIPNLGLVLLYQNLFTYLHIFLTFLMIFSGFFFSIFDFHLLFFKEAPLSRIFRVH